jgi:hypothetical protein
LYALIGDNVDLGLGGNVLKRLPQVGLEENIAYKRSIFGRRYACGGRNDNETPHNADKNTPHQTAPLLPLARTVAIPSCID